MNIKASTAWRHSSVLYLAVLAGAPILVACGGDDDENVPSGPTPITIASATTQCPALAGTTIPPSAFGLPTSGATVATAAVVPAVAASGAAFAVPEYCRVRGSITATNPADPPINFQVNLPSTWNVKAYQQGGGGFNGTVVTGTGNVDNAPSTAMTPLQRSYATFGSDSGSTSNGTFGMNAQALANYSGESVKRTHDVALALMNAYYNSAPQKAYYGGSSKGGHEALVAAQRYGGDYDGIIGYYPANQNQAMVLSWFRMWEAVYRVPGAWMNSAKQQLLKTAVLAACDALDGVADGIVSNLEACKATFAVNSLRCATGADTGDTCLSDAQIGALLTAATPMEFAFPLANGITSIGPYPVFNGGDITGNLYDAAGTGTGTSYNGFDDPVIRYFIQQNPAATTVGFDYRAWQSRVQQISTLYDSTNPNIDTFKAHGGKLLLVQGTTDMLVTHFTTDAQVDRMATRYGSDFKSFVRYYVVPGFGHGTGVFASSWDSLTALEDWAERGIAPTNQVTIDRAVATAGRTRPLCEYGTWPKYNGSGDVNSAASFTCAAS
jgi:Tannase and feruloyl esterase